MNLKKLIREEIDSFEWVDDIPTTLVVGSCVTDSDGLEYEVVDTTNRTYVLRITNPKSLYSRHNRFHWNVDEVDRALSDGTMSHCQ